MAQYKCLFIHSLLALSLLGSGHVFADEISTLNDYANDCGSFSLPKASVKFAPLEERIFLAKTQRTKDSSMRWSGAYQFTGSKEYAHDTIKLQNRKKVVWLLRDFEIGNSRQERKESIGNLPPYIWHVISVPRKPNNKRDADGYMVLKKDKFFDMVKQMPWSNVNPPLPKPSMEKLHEHLRRVPIRLTQTPTSCRVLPIS